MISVTTSQEKMQFRVFKRAMKVQFLVDFLKLSVKDSQPQELRLYSLALNSDEYPSHGFQLRAHPGIPAKLRG